MKRLERLTHADHSYLHRSWLYRRSNSVPHPDRPSLSYWTQFVDILSHYQQITCTVPCCTAELRHFVADELAHCPCHVSLYSIGWFSPLPQFVILSFNLYLSDKRKVPLEFAGESENTQLVEWLEQRLIPLLTPLIERHSGLLCRLRSELERCERLSQSSPYRVAIHDGFRPLSKSDQAKSGEF